MRGASVPETPQPCEEAPKDPKKYSPLRSARNHQIGNCRAAHFNKVGLIPKQTLGALSQKLHDFGLFESNNQQFWLFKSKAPQPWVL